MNSKVIYIGGNPNILYLENAENHKAGDCVRRGEFYGLSTDSKPTRDVKNGDILYLMDWKSLTEEEQTAAVSQVWMYDEENAVWLPQ